MGESMDRDSGWGIVMADRVLAVAKAGVRGNTNPLAGPAATGAVTTNAPGVTLTVLHSFAYASDGAVPNGLALGNNSVLYGTTRFGGSQSQNITGTSVGYGVCLRALRTGFSPPWPCSRTPTERRLSPGSRGPRTGNSTAPPVLAEPITIKTRANLAMAPSFNWGPVAK